MSNAQNQTAAVNSGPETKNDAINQVNAQLAAADLPTYSDLIATIEALTACAA